MGNLFAVREGAGRLGARMSVAELEQHRSALVGHCYRMLGSVVDADDAVQETMVRAWRSLERFDGRASLRTWLYRIATNVCLDTLNDRSRRERPIDSGSAGTVGDPLETRPAAHWVEPIADANAIPMDIDPSEQLILKQSIRLAFVAALQLLPAKQRAALLLADVLGWSSAQVAEGLETSVASVNSALQRARATLANRELDVSSLTSLPAPQTELLEKYVAAFEQYDVDALSSLLTRDAVLSMPPHSLWLQGPDNIRAWFVGPGAGCRGSRLVRTQACGLPAFAQYRKGGAQPWALILLEPSRTGDALAFQTSFLDTAALFPRFGLPPTLV